MGIWICVCVCVLSVLSLCHLCDLCCFTCRGLFIVPGARSNYVCFQNGIVRLVLNVKDSVIEMLFCLCGLHQMYPLPILKIDSGVIHTCCITS